MSQPTEKPTAPPEAATEVPPAPRSAGSDLPKRLATAAVAVPLLIGAMIVGGLWWMLLVVIVVGLGSYEFYLFMEAKGLVPQKRLGTLSAVALVVIAQGSNEYYVTLLLTASILAILVRQLAQRDVSQAISSTSVTIFGVIYVGWLGAHLVLIRNLGLEIADKYWQPAGRPVPEGFGEIGTFFVLLAIASTFLADTGGYFVGRAYGRHKLAPSISPKKTWEGLGGSVLFAVGAALAVRAIFAAIYAGRSYADDLGWGHCALLGAIIAGMGLAGDLVESLLKRDAQVKDASGLLPGHGGFLDRLDSLNFAVPVAYYYIKIYYFWNLTPGASDELIRQLGRYGLGW